MSPQNSPRFSSGIFIVSLLLGLLVAVFFQWPRGRDEAAEARPTVIQRTVSEQRAFPVGESKQALLVSVSRDDGPVTVTEQLSPVEKWIGSGWEKMVASQLDYGDFDEAFETVRAAPISDDRASALHNVLHVIRVSPNAQVPVFNEAPVYVPAPTVTPPLTVPAADDENARTPVINPSIRAEPTAFVLKTITTLKRFKDDLPIGSVPIERRQWAALTLARLRTAEAIANELEPTPIAHGAWLDIVDNYYSLAQWASSPFRYSLLPRDG